MDDTKRERDTGRYAPSVERSCVCGHPLSVHTSARVAGEQPCLMGEVGLEEGVACSCTCFKRAGKKKVTR